MEDVKFPEINTVEEMTGVISGTVNPINYNLAKEKQYFTYDLWIRMIKDMEDDDNIENFGDNKH
ncbi:15612_t:CDS:1, partial [Racocetra persica]